MKKKIVETFSRMKIYFIAIAYSRGNYNYHDFIAQYSNHTQKNFYSILHMAVEKAIVSEEIARKIQRVSVANSTKKAEEMYSDPDYISRIASKVFNSWQRKIEEARYFRFSKAEAKKIINQYAKCNISKATFCRNNCINIKLFDSTMIEAVINNWVDDECFQKLYEKALQTENVEETEHLFMQLTKRRMENKTSKK